MSRGLYLCAHAAEFPAQALLRLRTDWQTEAVVVMDGCAPQEWVCSMNRLAERRGAAVGMTRLEAESIPGLSPQRPGPVVGYPGLRLLKRSAENETAARKVFLECSAKFSPRIEEASNGVAWAMATSRLSPVPKSEGSPPHGPGPVRGDPAPEAPMPTEYALVLDIAGTERLFGPPAQLAERLRDELAEAGFRAGVAVSANYDTARMKAAGISGIAVIPEGAEADALAKLPIAALGLDEERASTFALWGIGTLGELACLPEADLVARMGPEARRWRALARGAAEHAFVPIEPEFTLEEFCEFEAPVEQIDSLLFVGARMIDCLVTRAAGRALALRSLKAEMRLEGGAAHSVTIRPAIPSADRKFLLKLLQLEIGAHPPQAAVVALTLRAEAGQTSKVQLGLFTPQTPEPSRLDVTLARLRTLVGEERVGSPVLEDTHRAGSFRMEGFAITGERASKLGGQRVSDPTLGARTKTRRGWGTQDAQVEDIPRMAVRRVRPARAVRVLVAPATALKDATHRAIPGPRIRTGGTQASSYLTQRSVLKPVSFRDGEQAYVVAAAYGPWRTSGCWWAVDAWDTDEWDVLAVRTEELASGASQGSKTNIQLAEEKQPQILRLRPAARGFAQDDRQETMACLLVHDWTRNAWRLEAFYD
ncbi:MAG: hypothetical protein ABSD70_03675 [Terracidiphilus sp.]|jgi:protein ImuB